MKNRILHLSHPTFDVNSIVPNSKLLCDIYQSLEHTEYHTSLGDLETHEILKVSHEFDTVNFINKNFDVNSTIYFETLLLLNSISHKKPITGYQPPYVENFLSMDVEQRPQRPTLWVFGCSHSYGTGLEPGELNFGQYISQQLDMPMKLVSLPGSSLEWSLRHLMCANFCPGDIVIWQITSPERISYGLPPTEIMLRDATQRHLIETFTDQHLEFSFLNSFNQGIRFLRSKQVKFVTTAIMNYSPIFYPCLIEFTKYPEYCFVPRIFLDRGNDQEHPGPLSHKALAQHLLDHLKYTNDQPIPQSRDLY